MIHHEVTAELSALRMAELRAAAEARRLRAAVPRRGQRRTERLAALARAYWAARRWSTAGRARRAEATAGQCA